MGYLYQSISIFVNSIFPRSHSLLLALVGLARLAQTPAWQDPCSHGVQFVTVDKNAQLEVPYWACSGRPVVLLAGGGDTQIRPLEAG